jgi:hypothetical protein
MRPALFYISQTLLRSGPSAREAEALRQARLAEIRSLIADIAAEPCAERASCARDAAPSQRELVVA